MTVRGDQDGLDVVALIDCCIRDGEQRFDSWQQSIERGEQGAGGVAVLAVQDQPGIFESLPVLAGDAPCFAAEQHADAFQVGQQMTQKRSLTGWRMIEINGGKASSLRAGLSDDFFVALTR